MGVFVYRGLGPTRKSIQGTILADSPRHARDQLRDQGVVIHDLTPQAAATASQFTIRGRGWPLSSRRAKRQWGLVAHELSMLLSAGIPLLDAMDTLVQQHTGGMRTAIMQLRDRVEAGSSLAAAMDQQQEIFDVASIRLVEVGENAGTLDEMLSEVAEFKLQLAELKDKVSTALIYPIFLACFGLVAMVFLMTVVMPPLLESLQESLVILPWPTRLAKAISDALVHYGWWILAIGVAVLLLLYVFARSEKGKLMLDRFVLRIPGLGPLLLKQSIARAALIIGLLSRSGIVLTSALQLAGRSTTNSVVRRALETAEQDVTAGEEIGDSLERSGCFPPIAVRFFSVGQETGKLDEMLQKLARDYNRQVATASARITAVIEPILILILAVAVGFLLLATILPILEAGNVS